MIDFIFVSDNPNNPMLKNAIDSIPKINGATVSVQGFKKNNGYNAALNAGIKERSNPIIAACNDDITFKEGSIATLIASLQLYDSVSPWCPLTHHEWWGTNQPKGDVIGYEVGKIIAGWCIFLTRDAWNKIKGFDERFKFWCSDNAYAEQLKKLQLIHALIPYAEVNHLQSQTLNKQTADIYNQLTIHEFRKFNNIYKK